MRQLQSGIKKLIQIILKKVNEFFRLIERLSDFKVQKGIQKIKDFPKESN